MILIFSKFIFMISGIPWRSRRKMCLYCSNESTGSRKNLRLENPIWTKTGQKSRRINRWHNARCPSHYAGQCYCNYPGKMGCSISILANSKLRSGIYILYFLCTLGQNHGLRTPNEGINIWKIGPMWQTKYASAVSKNLGLGLNFRPCSEGYFLSGRP